MKKVSLLIILILLVFGSFLFSVPNSFAYTQKDQTTFTQQTAAGTGLSQAEFAGIVAMVINIALGITGAIFVSLIVYGGVEWITSGGNPDKVGKAKKIIKFAVIGLIITAGAYTIAYFISSALEQPTAT
jgi:putative flippase GtrA